MIPEEVLDARADYVMQMKDVEWSEQRHKRIWRKQQLIVQIDPTNLSYVQNALKSYILNNFLINHFPITFTTIQQFCYCGISFQIATTILRK